MQGARDLAEQLRSDLAINRGQRGAGSAVEAVGRGTVWSLTLAGLTGLAAAFVLLVEKIALLRLKALLP